MMTAERASSITCTSSEASREEQQIGYRYKYDGGAAQVITSSAAQNQVQQQQPPANHPTFVSCPSNPVPLLLASFADQQQHQQQQQQQQQQPNNVLSSVETQHYLTQPQPQQPQQHNLIPPHLQQAAMQMGLTSLAHHGTQGHPPAIVSPPSSAPAAPPPPPAQQVFTVQDRPMQPPVYNGVNPAYPGLRVLNTSPPIFCVDQFLCDYECDFLIQHAQDSFGPAPVVGKGAGEVSPSRTSSTCYLAREDLPSVMRKVSLLTGKPIEHCELPQVGRYFPTQQYLQHYDAFDVGTDDGRRFAENGGQRTITVLIYLNTVRQGGATRFPALNLDVQPVRGMALVFFPATVDGLLDKMALHAALPAIDTKYVSQVWIRQSTYQGQPSKRLPVPLGLPFGLEQQQQQQQQQMILLQQQQQQQQQQTNQQQQQPPQPPFQQQQQQQQQHANPFQFGQPQQPQPQQSVPFSTVNNMYHENNFGNTQHPQQQQVQKF